jgi:hypothetical protein
MPARSFADIDQAERDGFWQTSTWRKSPTQFTNSNFWFDLSMSPGNPVPNYYIGASGVFTPLAQSTDGGIPHGGNVAPKQKVLRLFEAQCALSAPLPLQMMLLDYLGFYAFLDESVTDEQPLVNAVSVPRFPLGDGVQLAPIVVAAQSGGINFQVRYTNSSGVPNRMTPLHLLNFQNTNGTLASSGSASYNSHGPFMALQEGDTGVRTADAIQFLGTGDIGLISLALVKPIAKHSIRGIDAPVEKDFYIDDASLPVIADDAYLNAICLPSGSLQGAAIHGYIKTLFL